MNLRKSTDIIRDGSNEYSIISKSVNPNSMNIMMSNQYASMIKSVEEIVDSEHGKVKPVKV